jgi:hypothetical protein
MKQVYTFEKFKPAFPSTGTFGRVHVGTFEQNRDSLSPCMISTREFYAMNGLDAEIKARSLCNALKIEYC